MPIRNVVLIGFVLRRKKKTQNKTNWKQLQNQQTYKPDETISFALKSCLSFDLRKLKMHKNESLDSMKNKQDYIHLKDQRNVDFISFLKCEAQKCSCNYLCC